VPVEKIVEVEKAVEVEKIVERIVEVEVQWGRDQGDAGVQTDPSFSPIRERRTTPVLGRSPTATPRKGGTFLADAGGNEAEAENETETDMEGYEDARVSLRLGSRDDLGLVRTADFRSAPEGALRARGTTSRGRRRTSTRCTRRWTQRAGATRRRMGRRASRRWGCGGRRRFTCRPLRGRMWSRAWILPPLWSRAPVKGKFTAPVDKEDNTQGNSFDAETAVPPTSDELLKLGGLDSTAAEALDDFEEEVVSPSAESNPNQERYFTAWSTLLWLV
jgi:hypothetical protein